MQPKLDYPRYRLSDEALKMENAADRLQQAAMGKSQELVREVAVIAASYRQAAASYWIADRLDGIYEILALRLPKPPA